jgi:nucleoside-diphosphate-sugar epimerase
MIMSNRQLRVAVTGANGKLGRPVVDALVRAGHEVVGIDRGPSVRDDILFAQGDLADYGQAHDMLGSVGWDILGDTRDGAFDVVVHLAAIPHPRMFSNSVTFINNVAVAYNVFEACRRLRLKDIVLASSETVLGVPFGEDLSYLPLDEESPRRGRNAYGMSKLLTEHIAEEFCKNDPDLRVTSLRFSYVQNVEEYQEYPSFADDLDRRVWDLWAYIDTRDAADAVEKALHYKPRGFETFLVAADDTTQPVTTAELIGRTFPHVPVRRELKEYQGLLSNAAAKDKLGWSPQHSWRNHVSA